MTLVKKPLLIVALLALVVCSAFADDEKIQIHGFGGWVYGYSDGNGSTFASDNGLWDNYDFALNINAFPAKNVRINVQLFTTNNRVENTDVIVDYAFVEWKHTDWFKVRAGKVKHPFGNYGEILKAGVLRPFYNLPRSIYEASPVSDGYTGIGIVGSKYWDNEFGLRYHIYTGQVDVPFQFIDIQSVAMQVFFGLPHQAGDDNFLSYDSETTNTFGGQIIIDTPFEGFNFGVNWQIGDIVFLDNSRIDSGSNEEYTKKAYGFQTEYSSERILLRAEYAVSDVEIPAIEKGAYVEGAFSMNDNWQVVGRYDWGEIEVTENFVLDTFPTLVEHQEISFGLNYWVNPAFVIKSSYQMIDGNRFAYPLGKDLISQMKAFDVEEKTNLFLVGVHYSF